MLELIFFILIAFGMTQILVYGKIFEHIRPDKETFMGFFHCPMCVGFWVGCLLVLLSDYTNIYNFDISIVNCFLMSCLSSATSYVLCTIFGDEGIQFFIKKS